MPKARAAAASCRRCPAELCPTHRAGEHYAYELEEHLDDFLVEVFHVEAEDGSPSEVRRNEP